MAAARVSFDKEDNIPKAWVSLLELWRRGRDPHSVPGGGKDKIKYLLLRPPVAFLCNVLDIGIVTERWALSDGRPRVI